MIEEVFFLQNDQDRRAELRPYIEILSFWGESIEDYLFLLDVREEKFYFSSCIWEKYPLPFMDIYFGMEDWISIIDVRDIDKALLYKNEKAYNDFKSIAARLEGVSPINVLKRGFSVVYKDGKAINSVKYLSENDIIETKLSDGYIKSEIIEKGEINA